MCTKLQVAYRQKHLLADLALLVVTLIWGSTFVLVQDIVRVLPPYRFLAWRFAVAGLALGALAGRCLWHVPRRDLLAGAGTGLFLFAGYALQTIGLQFTTAARSGFLTGLAVVLVPLLSVIILGRSPSWEAMVGVGLAAAGLYLLSWPKGGQVDRTILFGDMLTLGCALSFALQIVLVGRYAPRMEPAVLSTTQILVVTLLSAIFSLNEPFTGEATGWVWGGIIFLGLFATALGFWVQARAQRLTTPTHVALIFAMEPVFAAFFAWLLTGEVLTGRSLAGCGLILAGMIAAESRRFKSGPIE